MQENEFEKNLQQKMEALQVQPSEESWQKIKAEVADKKRRRRGIVFVFLLAGLFISGLAITNMEVGLGKKEIAGAKNQELPIETKVLNEAEKNISSGNESLAGTKQNSKDVNDLAATVANENKSQNDSESKKTTQPKEKSKQSFIIKSKTKASLKTNVVAALADEMEDGKKEAETVTDDKMHITASPKKESDKGQAIKIDSVPVEKTEPLIIAKVETQKEEPKKPVTQKKKEQNNNKKWQLGLTFSGGISSTENKYSGDKVYSRDATATPGGALTDSAAYYTPSETRRGFSFAAGFALSRNISKTFSVFTGLQYMQINTFIKTGQPVLQNSVFADERFANGTARSYNNRYHFISLPVNISTKILSVWQRDVYFDAGISITRLLSTNALSFDTAQGNYYKSNNPFNKTQIGLNTSIAFNLASKNKAAFYMGPAFYYGFTPMAASGIHANAHPLFIGLKLQKNLW